MRGPGSGSLQVMRATPALAAPAVTHHVEGAERSAPRQHECGAAKGVARLSQERQPLVQRGICSVAGRNAQQMCACAVCMPLRSSRHMSARHTHTSITNPTAARRPGEHGMARRSSRTGCTHRHASCPSFASGQTHPPDEEVMKRRSSCTCWMYSRIRSGTTGKCSCSRLQQRNGNGQRSWDKTSCALARVCRHDEHAHHAASVSLPCSHACLLRPTRLLVMLPRLRSRSDRTANMTSSTLPCTRHGDKTDM